MKYAVWGLLLGFLFAPDRTAPELCRDEMWLVPEAVRAHFVCTPGAELQIEPMVVRCVCRTSNVLLTGYQ